MNNLEGTKGLARFAGPGAWNDADMLEVQPHASHVQALLHARMRRNLGTEVLPCHQVDCEMLMSVLRYILTEQQSPAKSLFGRVSWQDPGDSPCSEMSMLEQRA